MSEDGPGESTEFDQVSPRGVGLEFPNVPLLKDMSVSDLQAIIDSVLEEIEFPNWIEPNGIVAKVDLTGPGSARIRIVAISYLGGEQMESAVTAFKGTVADALIERNKQWNAEHPDL